MSCCFWSEQPAPVFLQADPSLVQSSSQTLVRYHVDIRIHVLNRAAPSYQKLWRKVRQRIDQTSSTRSSNAQNERIETGVLVKSQIWKNVSTERKVGECFQWEVNGQCSRGDSGSFNHATNRGQKAQSSSSTSRAPTQTDGCEISQNS